MVRTCTTCNKAVPFFTCTGEGVCSECQRHDWITYLENKMIEYASVGDESLAARCAYWIKIYTDD